MVRPRELTSKDLENLCSKKGVDFIKRLPDPNRIIIRYQPCKHESSVIITSLRKHNAFCWDCYEENIKIELKSVGLHYLAKLGNNNVHEKTSSSQRLVSCMKCGNFMFVLPKSVMRAKAPNCLLCHRDEIEAVCKEKDVTLLNKVDNNYVEVLHNACGTRLKIQVSNLRRHNINCRCKSKPKLKSFVYLCRIYLNDSTTVLKIGKSNNPYLRFQCFSEDIIKVDFISQIKLGGEDDAYTLEKKIHKLLSKFSVDPNIVRSVISNGFTECYKEDWLNEITEVFEREKRLIHD